MASFRTHISFGIAFGILSVAAMISLALVPREWSYFALIAVMVTLGALLPDIDSDSGLPFHITFGSLSLTVGGLSFIYLLTYYTHHYVLLITIPLLCMFIVWAVIGTCFKKFTRHRGMAHSVPAAILAGLITFSLADTLGFQDWSAFLLGLGLAFGYLVHLILDEVWAGLNFHGHLFVPNKAFGSALKFISHDHRLTALIYSSIFIMFGMQFSSLKPVAVHFWQQLFM